MFSLSPFLRNAHVCAHRSIEQFPEKESSSDHLHTFLPTPHMLSCHIAYGTARQAGMRDRQGMLWSYPVSAWDWRIIQLFSIVLPAAMYSHLDILERKGVWSSGKVKYPIILLSHWGDSETVIDMKRLLNERSQIIFVAHFFVSFLFFPSALLTNECQCFVTKTPTQVSHISGIIGYHGLAGNMRFS